MRVELAELLDHHVNTLAMVLGRALDVLAKRPSYRPGRSLALDVFLDEDAQALYGGMRNAQSIALLGSLAGGAAGAYTLGGRRARRAA